MTVAVWRSAAILRFKDLQLPFAADSELAVPKKIPASNSSERREPILN
jgi:hypothetical protein